MINPGNNYAREYVVTFDKRKKSGDTPYYCVVWAKDKRKAETIVDMACYNEDFNAQPFYPFHKHTILRGPCCNPKFDGILQTHRKFTLTEKVEDRATELGLC